MRVNPEISVFYRSAPIGVTKKHFRNAFVGKTYEGKLYRFVNPTTGETWDQEVIFFGKKIVEMTEINGKWYVLGPPGKAFFQGVQTYYHQGFSDTQFKTTWLYKHIYTNYLGD